MMPLITENMYFDVVLKALETMLKNEAQNQVDLGGSGWDTTRERFDPWNSDEFPLVNVAFNAAAFDESQVNQEDQNNKANYIVDCYASANALIHDDGSIVPKDQRAADVLHALISKVYYSIMTPVNRDLGLTPGTIETPIVLRIEKFVPTESNIPVSGIIASRLSVKITFDEFPPLVSGIPLKTINIDTETQSGGDMGQELDVT